MRWPAAVTLGVVGYLFFLIYALPAQQVVGWLANSEASSELRLAGASGTAWNGKARSVVYRNGPLGELSWDFRPGYLFLGKLAYAFELKDTGQQASGTLLAGIGGSYRVQNLDALLLAARLPELLQQQQVRVGGKVRASQLALDFDADRITAAEGSVEWLDGSLQSPLNLQIGDLHADLATDPDSGDITGQIRDLKGTIAVQAEVRLKADGNFQLDGKLKPGNEADPGLTGALQAVGRQQSDGTIVVKYNGKL
jgi:general secretion pathway protein N